MQRTLFSILFVFLIGFAKAQWVSIPDSNFGKWLIATYPTCMQGNPQVGFQMDTTCGGIMGTKTIQFNYHIYPNIKNITGIQFFDSLKTLLCADLQLDSLPILPSSLNYLDCTSNNISNIALLPDSLCCLLCGLNRLTIMPMLPNTLMVLECYNNQLSSFLSLPPKLESLWCYFNQLTSLPILPNSLGELKCYSNRLLVLPTLPNSLLNLECWGNQLISLPNLPDSLSELSCGSNMLHSLPILPKTLSYLECNYNYLIKLPTLSTQIYGLDCSYNQLTSLPVLPPNLIYFYCNNNPNLSCITNSLNSNMADLKISGTQIHCMPNRFHCIYFDINPDSLPLCGPSSGCNYYYNIEGNVHQKTQTTCAADSLNPGNGLQNIKVMLKDQSNQVLKQMYVFSNGEFSIPADSFTNYSLEIDTLGLPFSVECPSSQNYNLNQTVSDTITVGKNFGLSCRNNIDYAVNNIFAWRFRSTFQTGVSITAGDLTNLYYHAQCTQATSGTVTTTFTNNVHYISPAPNALTPTVSGNTLTYQLNNLDSLKQGDLDIILSTDSAATIGSQVCISSIIHSDSTDVNPSNDTLQMCFTIRNSYDPNDKTVSPKQISGNGEWLTYTIQFQNTGSDTAYTVVVRDTLPTEVSEESFHYLASSHKNIIEIKGKEAVFTFPKINLVDSATNEPLSHGWVQFRVKSKSNLPPVFSIQNRAAIYFDLNSAIYTPYAQTYNKVLGISEASSLAFSVQPNPTSQLLTVQINDPNPCNISLVDITGREILSQNCLQKTVLDLSNTAAGIYLLKLSNSKGQVGIRKVVKE